MIVYLSLEDLLALMELDGLGPVRDVGLLDSAALRPRATAFGEDAYPDGPAKAAALLQSLARNHALVDGNERLSWLAAETFLGMNGYVSTLSHDQAFDLVQDVATGRLDDVTVIGVRLAVARVPMMRVLKQSPWSQSEGETATKWDLVKWFRVIYGPPDEGEPA